MGEEESSGAPTTDAVDEFDLDIRLMPGLFGDGLHAMPPNTEKHTNCGTKCTPCIDPTRTCENCNKTAYTYCGSCGCHTKDDDTCKGCKSYASDCKSCAGPCGSEYGACTG